MHGRLRFYVVMGKMVGRCNATSLRMASSTRCRQLVEHVVVFIWKCHDGHPHS